MPPLPAGRARRTIPRGTTLALLACSLGSCAPPGPASPGPPAPPPLFAQARSAPPLDAPCDRAAALEKRATELEAEGRLDRATRALDRAIDLCPTGASAARKRLLGALATLGRAAEARALAEQLASAPEASDEERREARRLGESAAEASGDQARGWVGEAMAALERGDRAGAQWLFDRALPALEREAGEKAELSVSNGFGLRGSPPWAPSGVLLFRGERGPRPAWAFSPDGKTIAAGDGARVVLVEARSLREIASLPGHGADLTALSFSPDGARLCSGSLDRTARLWDAASLVELRRLDLPEAPRHVACPGGDELMAAGNTSAFASAPGEKARAFGKRGQRAAQMLPDGTTFFSGDDGASVWQLDRAGRGATARLELPAGSRAALSPDGSAAAVARGPKPAAIEIVPLRPGRPQGRVQVAPGGASRLWLSPRAKTLLVAGDEGTLAAFDVASGRELGRQQGEGLRVAGFLPGGQIALAGGSQALSLWAPGVGEPRALDPSPGARPAGVSPDGSTLIGEGSAGFDGALTVWDASTGRARALGAPHAEPLSSASFSPDGRALAGADGDGAALLLDLIRGRALELGPSGGAPVKGLSFSPDGATLASFAEGQLRLHDAASGAARATFDRPLVGRAFAAFGPGGALLATLSPRGRVQIFDVARGRGKATLEGADEQDVTAAAFSPDGSLLAAGNSRGKVQLWELASGPPRELDASRGGAVRSLFVGPGGAVVYVGGERGGVVRCERASGECRAIGAPHPLGPVEALLSPSPGRLLAFAEGAGGARVREIDLEAEREARVVADDVPADAEGAALAPSGRAALLASTLLGSSLVLDLSNGAPLALVRSLRDGASAYALDRRGRVELFGPRPPAGSCRIGRRSYPVELCLDRLAQPGLVRALLTGDDAELGP